MDKREEFIRDLFSVTHLEHLIFDDLPEQEKKDALELAKKMIDKGWYKK